MYSRSKVRKVIGEVGGVEIEAALLTYPVEFSPTSVGPTLQSGSAAVAF